MLLGYKYRIYPNEKQKEFFKKNFDASRFLYNKMLNDKTEYYKTTGKSLKISITKYKDEFPWLKEVDAQALTTTYMDLQKAFNKFFKNPSSGYPKPKTKKSNRQSYSTCQSTISICDGYIKLPKIGKVKIVQHREYSGVFKKATIIKTTTDKYYVSILVDSDIDTTLPKTDTKIGIDLGIKDFATTSNGEVFANPKFSQKSENKISYLRKQLLSKQPGSHNREKARIKLSKEYEKVANRKNDFQHKISKRLIDENQVICLEDLKIRTMINSNKGTKMPKYINDASLASFVNKLEYKGELYGRDILKVDKYFPSSQLCSNCGYKNTKVKSMCVREWTCPKCSTKHNRDINAAKNILNQCLKESRGGHGVGLLLDA